MITRFLLAEKSYKKELPFVKENFTFILNKTFIEQNNNYTKNNSLKFIYTGTIAKSYGIWEAISFIKDLHKINNDVNLKIVGYCSKKDLLENLKNEIQKLTFIELIGGDKIVPHSDIIKEINQSKFALLPYQKNISTEHRIPTKIYEYLATLTPMIISKNPEWSRLTSKYNASISIDFNNFEAQEIYNEISTKEFFTTIPGEEIQWKSEEEKLLAIFE